jgi:hypothetical protein
MVAAQAYPCLAEFVILFVGTYDMDSAPSAKGFERNLCSREVTAEVPMRAAALH